MKYKRYLIDGSLTEKRCEQILKKRVYNENYYRKKKKSINRLGLADCDIPQSSGNSLPNSGNLLPNSGNLLPNSGVNQNLYPESTLEEGIKCTLEEGIKCSDKPSLFNQDMEFENHSLLRTSKQNKRKMSFCNENEDSISSIASDLYDEYYKNELHKLRKKYSSLKKKCQLMETEKKKYENELMEKNECINYFRMELEKSIASIASNSEKLDMLIEKTDKLDSLLIEKTEEIRNFLKERTDEMINLQKQKNEHQQDIISSESETNERSTRKKDDSEMIQLGPVEVNKHTLAAVESIRKNSIFVKALSLLFWTKEQLMARSVTGRKAPNCKIKKEPKPPLTPEKLATIRDIFTKRLKKQYPEGLTYKNGYCPMDTELKFFNKYLGEKINDLIKCKARKSLIS